MIVTVAAALDALEIVALGSLDVAQAGAAAHHVDDDSGNHGAGAVGDTFLLQGYAGAGGGGDDAGAGTGSAVHHVDGRHFALGLQEAAADLGHTSGHVFGDLRLRSDGVTEEKACAGTNSGFRNRFAALHKSQSHILSASLVFFDSDHHIRTGAGTGRAADARFHVRNHCRMVALCVDVRLGQLDDVLGARSRTQAAALAKIFVDGNSYHSLYTSFLISFSDAVFCCYYDPSKGK